MIPQHVKQLDVTVKNVDEMIMVPKRFNHFYIVIFRFAEHFLGRPQEIVVWLQNKIIDFTYHYDYECSYLSIWFDKTMTNRQPLTMTPPHKRAKILHSYNDF
jgi:hypothetical protein